MSRQYAHLEPHPNSSLLPEHTVSSFSLTLHRPPSLPEIVSFLWLHWKSSYAPVKPQLQCPLLCEFISSCPRRSQPLSRFLKELLEERAEFSLPSYSASAIKLQGSASLPTSLSCLFLSLSSGIEIHLIYTLKKKSRQNRHCRHPHLSEETEGRSDEGLGQDCTAVKW